MVNMALSQLSTLDGMRTLSVRDSIDRIEKCYEFMLAYAMDGRHRDPSRTEIREIRSCLQDLDGAMKEIGYCAPQMFRDGLMGPFARRFLADLSVVRSALAMALERSSISAAMVENLNEMITVQSFLSDLFFIDQVMLNPREGSIH